MNSDSTLYFNEGAGFVFVGTLGQGNNGRADLVRSSYDNQLYVRKQLTIAFPVERETYMRPQREIKKATLLRNCKGVAKLQGWSIYADLARHQIRGDVASFEVTYWDFCNAGTLGSILSDATSRSVPLPEYWICSWLIMAIGTLSRLHEAGFAHKDAHAKNWFLHWSGPDTPEVILGDFDDTTLRRSTKYSRETQSMFKGDYKKLVDILVKLLLHSDRPTGGPLSALLTVMYRYSRRSLGSDVSIDKRMRILRNKAKEILSRLPPPTHDQYQLAQANHFAQSTTNAVPIRFHPWSPRVERYTPISPDPGFEIVASKGWERPFLKN